MSSKRALVVDDSKSARAFLSRILERHEITVDAAESAEAAIDYLTRNRPDVIFMDHMMPGMDGFQAVQSIKNNPRTAAIPILMYTSQEGDLYLGQARALGAEGVLPKQIKQADVTKMLFQLQLVSDRRTREQTIFTRAGSRAGPRAGQRIRHRGASPRSRRPPHADAASARRISSSRCCCRRCRSRSAPRSISPCRRKSPRCAASSALRSIRMPNGCKAISRHCCRRRARPTSTCPPSCPSAVPGARSSAGRWRSSAWRARRSWPGCGGTRAAKSPRCAPISPPPTPSSKRCAPGPR